MSEQRVGDWKPTAAFEKQGDRKRRSVRTDSGKVRRLPMLRYEEWCKPSGNLIHLVVATTRNTDQAEKAGLDVRRYGDRERRAHVAAGSFPWRWELAKQYTPHLVMNMGEQEWFAERERLLQERRATHNKRQSQMTEATKDQQADLLQAVKLLVEREQQLQETQISQGKKKAGL